MPIDNISRQVQSVSVSTTYSLTDPNINLIVANATSSGFTITIYNDLQSGAYHELDVKISGSDSSGNSVTIVDAAGVFSTSLNSTSAAVLLRTDQSGNWYIAAAYPTEDAATAISAADSAGLRASTATSTSTSAALNASTATSVSTSAALNASSATSASASLVITDSTTRSIAASATLSGVSGTASTATSQNVSQSATISVTGSVAGSATLSGVSATASVATSQNASQSLNVSSAFSLAAS